MNNNNFLGRLTRDPEVFEGQTSDNKKNYKKFMFTIAVDRKMSKDAKEKAKAENKPTADYPQFRMFVVSDDAIAYWEERLKKGVMVAVSKAIYRTETYTDKNDGSKKYVNYFEIDSFEGSELTYISSPQSQQSQEEQQTQGEPQTPQQPTPPAQTPQQTAPQQTPPQQTAPAQTQVPEPTDIGDAVGKLPWD